MKQYKEERKRFTSVSLSLVLKGLNHSIELMLMKSWRKMREKKEKEEGEVEEEEEVRPNCAS